MHLVTDRRSTVSGFLDEDSDGVIDEETMVLEDRPRGNASPRLVYQVVTLDDEDFASLYSG